MPYGIMDGGPEKAHPGRGTELTWKDKKMPFEPLDEKHLWHHPSFANQMAVDLTSADDRESFTFADWAYLRIGKDKVEVSGDLRAVRFSGKPACGDFAGSAAE